MVHYLGLSLQLIGMSFVGLCLFSGIAKGDYGKGELAQFIIGPLLFYGGTLIRKKSG
ncbi:MAG: hypothetical protein OXB84_06245 [Halobacteriovoraceae bacterium]|nr:hypothetical protein [Halobacteriovoraceae bacterium]